VGPNLSPPYADTLLHNFAAMAWCTAVTGCEAPAERLGCKTLPVLDMTSGFTVLNEGNRGVGAGFGGDWAVPRRPDHPADEDDYDCRKPENIVQATAQEAAATEASLMRDQMAHLESMLSRRREKERMGSTKKVLTHYENVLEDMSRVAVRLVDVRPRSSAIDLDCRTTSCSPRGNSKSFLIPREALRRPGDADGKRGSPAFTTHGPPSGFRKSSPPPEAKRRPAPAMGTMERNPRVSSKVSLPSAPVSPVFHSRKPTSPRSPVRPPQRQHTPDSRSSVPREGAIARLPSSQRERDGPSMDKHASNFPSYGLQSPLGPRRSELSRGLPPCRPDSEGRSTDAKSCKMAMTQTPPKTAMGLGRPVSCGSSLGGSMNSGFFRGGSQTVIKRRQVVAL